MRFFDRKVARLVGYRGARANYAMLQEIPARLREHAKNKQADLEAAKGEARRRRAQALVADGVEAAEARVEQRDAVDETAEEAVAKITAELQRSTPKREPRLGRTRTTAIAGPSICSPSARPGGPEPPV